MHTPSPCPLSVPRTQAPSCKRGLQLHLLREAVTRVCQQPVPCPSTAGSRAWLSKPLSGSQRSCSPCRGLGGFPFAQRAQPCPLLGATAAVPVFWVTLIPPVSLSGKWFCRATGSAWCAVQIHNICIANGGRRERGIEGRRPACLGALLNCVLFPAERRHGSMCGPSPSPASPASNPRTALAQVKTKACVSGHSSASSTSKPFKTPKDNLLTSNSKQHTVFPAKGSRDKPW